MCAVEGQRESNKARARRESWRAWVILEVLDSREPVETVFAEEHVVVVVVVVVEEHVEVEASAERVDAGADRTVSETVDA